MPHCAAQLPGFGNRAAPLLAVSYMLGHLSVVAFDVDAFVDVDAEDDAFAVGLALAAWATAEPPPTSAPVTMRAIAAFLIWCRMSFTSLLVRVSSRPVKRG
ncbi:MAG: hypothetical protein ABI869_05970 [Actinomycetota bacterium]